MTVALIASTLAPQAAYATGEGSLQVTSTNGSAAEYRATRIADVHGLPIDEAFDWPALSGAQAPGYEALPTYNPNSATAAAQGRRLVERVSADLAHDEDGSLAQWLAANARADAPYITVLTDAAPVSVEDGWYLLRATGRRPLFAWVEGEPVTLGDKSDTPTVDKEVSAGDGWGDAAVGGSGRVFNYRVSLTVPHTFELYSVYKVVLHDEHDERLILDAESLKLELLRPSTAGEGEGLEPVTDLTSMAVLEQDGNAFAVTVPDLTSTDARPGDVVRATYRMTVDPLVRPGSNGLLNDVFAAYPAMGGDGETPHDKTRSYLVRARVHKVNDKGEALEGARFAVRGPDGSWLAGDGEFGSQAGRAEFISDAQGLIEDIPALAPGSYELVELAAPDGYIMPQNPVHPFEVSVKASFDDLVIDVEAAGPAHVEDVNAEDASFTLRVENKPDEPLPGTDEDMPQTGEGPWRVAVSIIACVGALALVAGMRARESHGER